MFVAAFSSFLAYFACAGGLENPPAAPAEPPVNVQPAPGRMQQSHSSPEAGKDAGHAADPAPPKQFKSVSVPYPKGSLV